MIIKPEIHKLIVTETVCILLSISYIVIFIGIYMFKKLISYIKFIILMRRLDKLSIDLEKNNYLIDECPICMDEKHLVKSKCRHQICKECWKTIIIKIKTCPYCRKLIDIKSLNYIKKNEN